MNSWVYLLILLAAFLITFQRLNRKNCENDSLRFYVLMKNLGIIVILYCKTLIRNIANPFVLVKIPRGK